MQGGAEVHDTVLGPEQVQSARQWTPGRVPGAVGAREEGRGCWSRTAEFLRDLQGLLGQRAVD